MSNNATELVKKVGAAIDGLPAEITNAVIMAEIPDGMTNGRRNYGIVHIERGGAMGALGLAVHYVKKVTTPRAPSVDEYIEMAKKIMDDSDLEDWRKE